MRGRHWALIVGVVVVSAAVIVSVTPRGRGQGTRVGMEPLGACVASHPVAGGNCYLYVVASPNVISILENGVLAASYQLPRGPEGLVISPRYTICAGRNEPVVGGNAYCHVIDRANHCIYVFVNARYSGTETLPETGDPLQE
jgi:hypothetical protein